MPTQKDTLGQIITFYSYKGGTGRSMAVANCACWLVKTLPLARVLVMDWDLEAPGLHRYFAETADNLENRDRAGIINYFDSLQQRLREEPALYEKLEAEDGWKIFAKEFPLNDYLIRNVVKGVDFIKAGNYDASYAELISTFNWVNFYETFGSVFIAFKDFLLNSYDFCLVDSRTGFNDVSGICTMLLPEKLVLVFTPNRQNISGVIDLAGRAAEYRMGSHDPRTLSLFPLPSRIENAELDLKTTWEQDYQREFETKFKSIYELDSCNLTRYFDDVQLPHVSFYSYGEEIAMLREERSGALSLNRAYELFFQRLVGLRFAWEELKSEATIPVPATVVSSRDDFGFSSQDRPSTGRIYLSYAHLDNVQLRGDEGWVDRFQEALQIRLAQLLGYDVDIVRDSKLRGNDYVDDHLLRQIVNSSFFVAIITPAYVKSDWCREEFRHFLEATAPSDSGVARRERVFTVVKTPVDKDDWFPEFKSLGSKTLQYNFYERDKDGRFREFSPDHTLIDKRFWERLDDVAVDIARVLTNRDRKPETRVGPADGSDGRIYLAETSPDLEFQRENIRRELEQSGYEVLPQGPLPQKAELFSMAVRECLAQCSFSVHMVGDSYGRVPQGATRSTVEIQNELAVEGSESSNLARVIWMPIGISPLDERQREFVKRLQFDANAQTGADLVQTSLQDLKVLIERKLTAGASKTDSPHGTIIRIYLICDERDLDHIAWLEHYLFGLGYEVILPVFEGEPAEILMYHKDNLLLCDAVLIFYGAGGRAWIHSKLTDVRKALGWGRSKPFLTVALFIAEPLTEEKRTFRTHEALVLQSDGKLDPESLQSFVRAIEERKRES